MKISMVMRGGLIAASLAAGGAFAQSLTPVLTDAQPLPAEERSSVGAVVLETSMVRAQRKAFEVRSTPRLVHAVGRDATRAERGARTKEELAQEREDAQIRLHEMGAGALTAP